MRSERGDGEQVNNNQGDQVCDQADPDRLEDQSPAQMTVGAAQHFLRIDALDPHRGQRRGEIDEIDRCDGDYQEGHDQQQPSLAPVTVRFRAHAVHVVRVENIREQVQAVVGSVVVGIVLFADIILPVVLHDRLFVGRIVQQDIGLVTPVAPIVRLFRSEIEIEAVFELAVPGKVPVNTSDREGRSGVGELFVEGRFRTVQPFRHTAGYECIGGFAQYRSIPFDHFEVENLHDLGEAGQ